MYVMQLQLLQLLHGNMEELTHMEDLLEVQQQMILKMELQEVILVLVDILQIHLLEQ